jgi:hypothetical protein
MNAITNTGVQMLPPPDDGDARDLTPAEIRRVLFDLARRQIDERAARPAIAALNRIMRDLTPTPLPRTAK